MNYKHIILTRFNLQYELQSDIHIQAEWLEERFRLFEQYCLPSILAQSTQAFDWIIFISDQTPTTYLSRLQLLTQAHANIHLVPCPYQKDYTPLYKRIGEQYIGDSDYLLSTRLDNDDMLASNYVQLLQDHISASTPAPAIISFPRGIQWFECHDIAFAVRYNKNHYLNFWEEKSNILTSLGADHTLIKSEELYLYPEPNMWCEIVHEGNISNGYVPKYRYSLGYSTSAYPIQIPQQRIRQIRFLLPEHIRFRYQQCVRLIKRLF